MRALAAVVGFWFRHCLGGPSCSTGRSPTCSRAPRAASCAPSSGATYPLAEAAQAQIDLQARRTTGKLLLGPDGRADARDFAVPRAFRTHRMPVYLVPWSHVTAFADLGLSESTLLALQDVGYEKPSPIQEQAIPPMLDGPRHHRPGADRLGQDRGVRAADPRVRRSRPSRRSRRSS